MFIKTPYRESESYFETEASLEVLQEKAQALGIDISDLPANRLQVYLRIRPILIRNNEELRQKMLEVKALSQSTTLGPKKPDKARKVSVGSEIGDMKKVRAKIRALDEKVQGSNLYGEIEFIAGEQKLLVNKTWSSEHGLWVWRFPKTDQGYFTDRTDLYPIIQDWFHKNLH